MAIDGIKSYYNQYPQNYHVATEENVELIINSTFKIMEETGIRIQSEEGIKLLVDNGCTADGEIVKFPAKLVKDAINSAANEVVLYTRTGKEAMRVGGNSNYYGPGPTNPFVNDFETGERREPKKSDVANSAKVVDACENIDYLMGLANITDCNVNISDVAEAHEAFKNTIKPSVMWSIDNTGMQDIFDMCAAISGSWDKFVEKPFMSMFVGCPQTPLMIPGIIYDKLVYSAKSGCPTLVMTGPQIGATAPVTIAGGMVVGLAEVLATLVISQLVNKNCKMILGVVVLTMDMKTTRGAYGTPEHCLCESLQADIFHYLNLPFVGTGGVTESKIVDEQAAIESTMQILSTSLSHANMVHDVGFMDGAMSGSLDQIVMCNEIISFAKRIADGIKFDEESLALDVIAEVGACGDYLSEMHTFENFREALWVPQLADREMFAGWERNGSKDMRTVIHEKTAEILSNHKCEPLSPEAEKAIDEIWERAKKRV